MFEWSEFTVGGMYEYSHIFIILRKHLASISVQACNYFLIAGCRVNMVSACF
jgi:hypothetical protein